MKLKLKKGNPIQKAKPATKLPTTSKKNHHPLPRQIEISYALLEIDCRMETNSPKQKETVPWQQNKTALPQPNINCINPLLTSQLTLKKQNINQKNQINHKVMVE